MASTDARPVPQKNVAYRVIFPILDADGDLVTGAAGLDSEISKDQGTFADCTNEATEIATSSGVYLLDLTSTEMNADTVAIIVKTSTTGAKTAPIVLYPEETGDIRVNATALNGTTLTARDIGANVLLSAGTGTGQLDFTSGVVKANVTQFNGSNATSASGRPEVNTTHVGGTLQTARDLGASVLLSSGTGTGQISLSSGAVTVGTNNDKTGYSLSQSFPTNFASLSITAAGLVATTSNVKKNAAHAGFTFVMTDNIAHTPVTGRTVTATRSIDGAAFASCANAVAEVASGVYSIDLAAADVNGDFIMLRLTAVGADDLLLQIVTQP